MICQSRMALTFNISRLLTTAHLTMKCTLSFTQRNHHIFSALCRTGKTIPDSYVYPPKHFSTQGNQHKLQTYLSCQDEEIQDVLSEHMTVYPDFITEEEEKLMLDEVDRYMKRLRYEFDHWDNAIHGYRETEKKNWNVSNQKILERVKQLAFVKDVTPLAYVHVLDIAKDGYIKPHVDAVRFCGDTITGLCLLSSCVMRLAMESNASKFGDILLPRRCLYVMRGQARYDFTHEVLKDEESYFNNEYVPRDRRISVICRNEPRHEDTL